MATNADKFPMQEHDRLFIEIKDETIAAKYPFDANKRGKWMLFISINQLDEMWQKALRLYMAGELTGIVSIKTSTAAANPRASETEKGAIRFACGPSNDQETVLKYGRNVVAKLGYHSDRGYIAYKTDQQTAKGTRATGAVRNFHYRITVPTQNPSVDTSIPELYNTLKVAPNATQQDITKAYRKVALEVHPDKNKGDPTAEDKFKQLGKAYETLNDKNKRAMYDRRNKGKENDKKIEIPSRTWTNEWVHEIDDTIALQYQLDWAELGRWTLTFPKGTLDAAWVNACKLYRNNQLTGISFLKSTTAKAQPGHENRRVGVIFFFCGPRSDKETMMEYGRNLVLKMAYSNPYGNIQFKVESITGRLTVRYNLDL